MNVKYNFIRTQDQKVAEVLKEQGLKLVDDKNGFFTFVNDKTLKFSEDVDTSKIHYTNMLCL
jgi:hypothetical protein